MAALLVAMFLFSIPTFSPASGNSEAITRSQEEATLISMNDPIAWCINGGGRKIVWPENTPLKVEVYNGGPDDIKVQPLDQYSNPYGAEITIHAGDPAVEFDIPTDGGVQADSCGTQGACGTVKKAT